MSDYTFKDGKKVKAAQFFKPCDLTNLEFAKFFEAFGFIFNDYSITLEYSCECLDGPQPEQSSPYNFKIPGEETYQWLLRPSDESGMEQQLNDGDWVVGYLIKPRVIKNSKLQDDRYDVHVVSNEEFQKSVAKKEVD